MHIRTLVLSLAAAGTLTFAACGGGGGSTSPPTNPNNGATPVPSVPASTPVMATIAGSNAFVTPRGMTLYVFGADTPNVSNCNASNGCTGIWPPYTAPAGTSAPSGFTLTNRSDGSLQWTVNGSPLYQYSGDSAPGQTNGNGLNTFGGVWNIARPAPGSTSTPAPPPSSYSIP